MARIKQFLEDQKHEVKFLSLPRYIQEHGKVEKELFDEN